MSPDSPDSPPDSPKFGAGRVLSITGFGEGTRITVKFNDPRHGEKTLSMALAKLERMR